VSPRSLTLGTTGNAQVSGPVVVRNTGTGPLHVTISGPKHNPPLSKDTAAFTVGPASSTTVTVTFAPSKKGTTKEKLSIKSDDPSHKNAIEVKLKGVSK
jgi:hypothetical protein